MLIFGWGGTTPRDFGPTVLSTCPNCQNRTVMHYVRTKKWFRLFFLPVFPHDTQHYLLCPVCTRGISLSPEQAGMALDLAQAYNAWYAHEISDDQYNAKASRLLQSVAPVEQALERKRTGADPIDDVVSALPSRDFDDGAVWYADPSGRHEQRFWDGSAWTAYVADGAVTGSDAVLNPSAAGWFPDPTRRNESRYWDGRFWTDHVQNHGAPSNDPFSEPPT